MARTGEAAIAWAQKVHSGYGGMCLQFVRLAFGVGPKYANARTARLKARRFHRTSDPRSIPRGVPVFLGDNHIALSVGGGNMITTNSHTNKVRTVTIQSWINSGFYLQGWSEDLNGVTVYKAPPPSVRPPKPQAGNGLVYWEGVYNNRNVGKIQYWLRKSFPGYKNSVTVKRGVLLTADNDYGPQTTAWVREFQRRVGLPQSGSIDKTTLAKMKAHGLVL